MHTKDRESPLLRFADPNPRAISRSFLLSAAAARPLQEKGPKVVTYEAGIFRALIAARETFITPVLWEQVIELLFQPSSYL